jgi:1-acyl-sn-glycerol-3-phosphate acyltransferase
MINHLSHFDVPAFIGHWPKQIRWVLKEELRRIPVFGWYCAAGGHVYVDRSKPKRAVESLRDARERIRDGVSVVFFPEGTRSMDGRMGPFKKGGFMTALDLDLPILPVSISGSQCVLPPGTLRLRPGRIRIRVHAPVDVKPYGLEMRDRLMAHVREIIASGIEEEAVDPRQ